jgi:adenylate cyclase
MTPVGVVARVRSGMFPSALQRLAALGAVETETEEQRLRRSTLVLSTFLVCALTPFWVATYLALGLPVPASIPLAYLVVSIALLVWFGRPSGTPRSGQSSCR